MQYAPAATMTWPGESSIRMTSTPRELDGRPLLSVLMPVYNETRTLCQVVEAVQAVPLDKEIILVDDGSCDGSSALIDALADGARVRAYHHRRNAGKGAAVRTAVAHARGQIVLIQDADLEY